MRCSSQITGVLAGVLLAGCAGNHAARQAPESHPPPEPEPILQPPSELNALNLVPPTLSPQDQIAQRDDKNDARVTIRDIEYRVSRGSFKSLSCIPEREQIGSSTIKITLKPPFEPNKAVETFWRPKADNLPYTVIAIDGEGRIVGRMVMRDYDAAYDRMSFPADKVPRLFLVYPYDTEHPPLVDIPGDTLFNRTALFEVLILQSR